MAIKSGLQFGPLNLAASTDATVVSCTADERKDAYEIHAHSIGVAATVELFYSIDATSAAGERIEQIVLAADETKSFRGVSVAASRYLIVQSDSANVTCYGKYTHRTGGDK